MLPTIIVFYFLLGSVTDEELDFYDKKLDSCMRELICQGYFVKNFQDKVKWS